MSVKIRLRRTGKVNQPCHRIVVTDSRSPRDGKFIECIGNYDPRHKTELVDLPRAEYWVAQGAQPSETVAAILNRARKGTPMTPETGRAKAEKLAAKAAAAKPAAAPVAEAPAPAPAAG